MTRSEEAYSPGWASLWRAVTVTVGEGSGKPHPDARRARRASRKASDARWTAVLRPPLGEESRAPNLLMPSHHLACYFTLLHPAPTRYMQCCRRRRRCRESSIRLAASQSPRLLSGRFPPLRDLSLRGHYPRSAGEAMAVQRMVAGAARSGSVGGGGPAGDQDPKFREQGVQLGGKLASRLERAAACTISLLLSRLRPGPGLLRQTDVLHAE